MLLAEAATKALGEAGWQVLGEDDLGDPQGRAWTELGATDTYGHQHGWKLAHHLAGELRRLERRVVSLLEHGWQQVVIVTDHGWLFLPEGLPVDELPKDALPVHLTEQGPLRSPQTLCHDRPANRALGLGCQRAHCRARRDKLLRGRQGV